MCLHSKLLLTFSVASIAFTAEAMWTPEASFARDRGWGGFGSAGGIIGGAIGRTGSPDHQGSRRHRGGGGSSDRGRGSPDSQESKRINALMASGNAVLLYDAAIQIARNQKAETNRNVDAAIKHFIEVLVNQYNSLHSSSKASAGTASSPDINQITEGEIRVGLDKAYQEAHLTDFEALAGEVWTRDRLQVQILKRGMEEIKPYFSGVGAKGPDANNLQDALKQAAVEVYACALELAEIIGVSRSFNHFMHAVYEYSAPAELQGEDADVLYELMTTREITDLDYNYFVFKNLNNRSKAKLKEQTYHKFVFNVRARRALYDCLAFNYVAKRIAALSQADSSQDGSHPTQSDVFATDVGMGKVASTKPTSDVVTAPQTSDPPEDVSEQVWKLVSGKCQEIARPIAKTAAETGLKPISLRVDLAVANSDITASETDMSNLETPTRQPQ